MIICVCDMHNLSQTYVCVSLAWLGMHARVFVYIYSYTHINLCSLAEKYFGFEVLVKLHSPLLLLLFTADSSHPR